MAKYIEHMRILLTLTLICSIGLATAACTTQLWAQSSAQLQGSDAPANAIWLDSLDLTKLSQQWGRPHVGRSVTDHAMILSGNIYSHGIGTDALSEFVIDLKGTAKAFVCMAGIDDEMGENGSVIFQVWVDGEKRADSGKMAGGQTPKRISIDLTGAKTMPLRVEDAGNCIDCDHADWAGAMLDIGPCRRR